MQTLSDIKRTLAEHGLAPRKTLGQNFLIDHNLTKRLVDVSGVGEGECVLEVGPGTGVLTDALLARGCRVVACELDRGLAALLRERLGPVDNFMLVEGDCLESKRRVNPELLEAIGDGPFTLVANLPYAAATPLMVSLMADHPRCLGQYVTIQREVADRLAAKPGSKAYGAISIIAALTCDIERVATLPPECFWPRPDVTSAMIGLKARQDAPPPEVRRRVLDACQKLFTTRRKQLGGVLKQHQKRSGTEGEASLPDTIDPASRIEDLTPSEILAIAGLFV